MSNRGGFGLSYTRHEVMCFSHTSSLFDGSETARRGPAAACRRRLGPGGARLHSFQYLQESKKGGGARINTKVCVCEHSAVWRGVFFFKHANMQHVGGSHGLKSFQRESIHAFQMEYLSIERVHEPGGEINLCDDV